ncbi:molecular chaperone DnaJ [Kitasatospora sp. NPDC093679]|uniref:molecular chaperone DnaJ n=1 Tax=Kitasatospora sp. NPDC093679 TaxID=3154983 RepID=UPI00342CB86C
MTVPRTARPPAGPGPAPRTFADAAAAVLAATGPAELFPDDPAEAARRYRRLARLLHPDTAPTADRPRAAAAFLVLGRLWEQHRGPAGDTTAELRTGRHTYRLGPVAATGDIAVLRAATTGSGTEVLLKIPRSALDSDLLEREATALTRLARHGDRRFHAYAPTLLETFRHQDTADPADAPRQVNALVRREGLRPLTDVLAAHPDGLDPRDAAWIWRRLLVALGYAHRAGVRHGAVLPEHVLVHPADHGLVLVDWCYAGTGAPAPAPALVERHRALYPPEVPARQAVTEATDIHLATRCIQLLMGDRAPRQLRAFVAGCTLPAEPRRPHDAWKLLAELDELLHTLYGPRTFRPFHLPPTA